MIDDQKTAAERYSSAMVSSDLSVKEGRCDVDSLIAAGWSPDGLGVRLLRLRGELDAVYARQLPGVELARRMLASMRPTALAVRVYAMKLADRQGFEVTPAEAADVADLCIDAWLLPLCTFCDGRGFNGEPGKPRLLCTACHGSGRRSVRIGDTEPARKLGRSLLYEMERKVSFAERCMADRQRSWT